MSRTAALALALLGVLALVASVIGNSQGGSGEERPPGSSASDTGPGGLAAWRALLEDAGHEVEVRDESPGEQELDPQVTAIVLDPGTLAEGEREALTEFVEAGGDLVVGGELDTATLTALVGSGVRRSFADGPAVATPLVPAPQTAGVARVSGAGAASFESNGPGLALLGSGGAATALLGGPPEAGSVVALAESSPLQNERLDQADNAQFALRLVATEEVAFLDNLAGEQASGLAALPSQWLWAGFGLLLAALTLVAARARRLGPPDLPERELAPPRRQYLDALATSLARSGPPGRAIEPVRAAAREQVRRRAGLGADASPEQLEQVAARLGLAAEEIDAVFREGANGTRTLEAGRALAKLSRATEVSG